MANFADASQPKRKPQPGDPDYQIAGPDGPPAGLPGGPIPEPRPIGLDPNELPPAPAPQPNQQPGGGVVRDFGPGGNVAPAPGAPAPSGPPITAGALPASIGGPGAENPSVWAQRVMAVQGGSLTPEQKATLQGVINGGAMPGAGGGTPSAPGAPAAPTLQTSFRDALLKQLGQDPNAVSAQSPELQGSLAANRLSEQRSFERNRAMLAERAHAQGISDTSGAFESGLEGLAQDRAGRESSFEGNAVADLAKQERDKLVQYIALAGNELTAEEQRALTERLTNLDAQIRREGIQQQGELGRADIASRSRIGEGQLNLGLGQLLSGNQQFGQQLAAQLGMFNQNALLQALGMV